MSIFLDAFWPNLASTLVGIVLGVPIALVLNQRILSHQRRLQLADTQEQVKHAIDVLIGACEYNANVLNKICSEALDGRVMHSPDLRITTWESVGPILCNNSLHPELLQMLSHHWLRLQRIQALNDEIFARDVAKSLPEIKDQNIAQEFWQILYGNSFDLSGHAGQAIEKLKILKSEIS